MKNSYTPSTYSFIVLLLFYFLISKVNGQCVVDCGVDQTICSGQSALLLATVTGSTPPYTYYWSPGTGLSNRNIANPVASPTSTIKYYCQVTNVSGCNSIDSVTVNVDPLPVPVITGLTCVHSGTPNINYTTPSVLGHTYFWSAPGSTFMSGQNTNSVFITWSSIGNYTVSVTEQITSTGCSKTVSKNVYVTDVNYT